MGKKIAKWETKENADIVLKVREAQIHQLYRLTWVGLIGTLVVAVAVCIALWQAVPSFKLFFWLGVLSLLIIARGFLSVVFIKKSPSGDAIYQWANLHAIGAAASALMWGLPSILLWPDGSPVHQMVWPICIVAISASAVAMYCTWTPSYLSFLILSVVPISIRLLVEGQLVFVVLGMLGFLFTAILSQTGKSMHDATLSALVVSIRNETLSAVLSVEKTKAEKLNRQLQQEITEREHSQDELRQRNQELESLNKQLTSTKNSLESTNKELEIALHNVKQLSGMLPICASCKKIRNDKGYWEHVEAFIRDHSEAQFSHGICPECAKELYPQMFDKK